MTRLIFLFAAFDTNSDNRKVVEVRNGSSTLREELNLYL